MPTEALKNIKSNSNGHKKIKPQRPSCIVFCTAPVEKINDAIRLLPDAIPFKDILFVGPVNSPFSQRQNFEFVPWKTGPFTWGTALAVWSILKNHQSVKVILPLNNNDGRGYFTLRVFCLLIGGGLATEVTLDGIYHPINIHSFLTPFHLEKKFYITIIRTLIFILPLFRIWLHPRVPKKPTNLNGPIQYKIVRSPITEKKPEVTVVIRTYNEAKFISKTLELVLGQKGILKEILIIDSQSTDTTLEIASSFPVRIAVIEKGSFHYGKVLNLGAHLAHGKIVVCLSAHAIPTGDDWLENLIAPLEEKRVAGVHGRELPLKNWCSLFEQKILTDSFKDQFLVRTDDFFFSNANAAFPRTMIIKFPFSESVSWAEDQLWAHQVQKAGYKTVYQPTAVVYHSHNLTLRQNFERCLKYFQTLFENIYQGDPSDIRMAFRSSLIDRSLSLRRFLVERKLMHPLLALFYSPYCEYVNYLGCELAWRGAPHCKQIRR